MLALRKDNEELGKFTLRILNPNFTDPTTDIYSSPLIKDALMEIRQAALAENPPVELNVSVDSILH